MTNTWEERFDKKFKYLNWQQLPMHTSTSDEIKSFIREERKRWVDELRPLIERAEKAFEEFDRLTK